MLTENAVHDPRIKALDNARLFRWPVSYERLNVPTRYGNTHILACGPQDAPPVVLLHALGVTSTMWLANASAWSRAYRLYALDTIGDNGQSRLENPELYPKNGQAYSQWLADVFDALDIVQTHVIGSSMGGWITMSHAIYAPDRVRRIVLLGPMGLPSWMTLLRVLSHLWSVLFFPTQSNMERIVRWALGDDPQVNSAFAEYLTIGATSRSSFKLAPPLPFSDDLLRQIKAPALLILGERDHVIGNARALARRARRFISDIQMEIIPGAGHMLSTECPELVNERVLRFLAE